MKVTTLSGRLQAIEGTGWQGMNATEEEKVKKLMADIEGRQHFKSFLRESYHAGIDPVRHHEEAAALPQVKADVEYLRSIGFFE